MSRWKKAIFTGIALVSLLTLIACGKATSSNSSHTSSKSESIIIGSSGSGF